MILRGWQELEELRPAVETPEGIITALGVSRSRAYALCRKLPELLPSRGPGRPCREKQPEYERIATQLHVTELVRDYNVRHPGAMVEVNQRMRYSDGFRSFALGLIEPGGAAHALTRAEVARALGVPLHTLNSWLYAGPKKLRETKGEAAAVPASPGTESACWSGEVEAMVALWDSWKGNVTTFARAAGEQGIKMSQERISQILQITGRRPRKLRNRHQVDAEALRGALERFYPNAQVATDGKYVDLTLHGEQHRFCWQLVTDVATGAHLGLAVRDQEDSKGFVDAYEQAKATAGGVPLAALRDNRSCNVSGAVEAKLEKDNVLSMTSRKGRPQTNGTTEGAFSLFEQSMPDISLDDTTPRELARTILHFILTAYCSGRNQTPRKALKSITPAEAFSQPGPDDGQREEARQRLSKMKKRAKQSGKRRARRQERPAVRKLMLEVLEQLGVAQPRKGTIDKLVSLGLDPALEAAGIVLAKVDNGLELSDDPERYLLKIAINLANRDEDLATFEHTVKLRTKAGEIILDPLHAEDARLKETLSNDEYLTAVAKRALTADTRIDRHFWWQLVIATLSALPEAERTGTARKLARRVATGYSLHYRERDMLIGQLAKAATPLPGGM